VKSWIAYAMVFLLALMMTTVPAMAQYVQSIPFITTGNAVFVEPFAVCPLTIMEFNSVSLTSHDLENLSISFPPYADGLHVGPAAAGAGAGIGVGSGTGIGTDDTGMGTGGGTGLGAGTGATAKANVLPFGPVNLAFPDIAQTVDQGTDYRRTYFFTDTFSAA
jgi:hypothetical protein